MWKFNHFFKVDTPFAEPLNFFKTGTQPVYDGKLIWATLDDGSIGGFEFWGPYNDGKFDGYSSEYSNESSTRWQENDIDLLTLNNDGPRLVLLYKVTSIDGVGFQNSPCYYNGFIYIIQNGKVYRFTPTTFKPETYQTAEIYHVISENPFSYTYNPTMWLSDTESQAINPNADVPVVPSGQYYNYEPFSNVVGVNGSLFWVDFPLSPSGVMEKQRLNAFDISSKTHSVVGDLPGKRLIQASRYLALFDDSIYVSAKNTSQLHIYNAETKAFITSVVVNRDIEQLFRVNNKLYAISTDKATVTLGDSSFPSSMVSEIGPLGSYINHEYGIVDGGVSLGLVNSNSKFWFVTKSGELQRTDSATNLSFISKNLELDSAGPDYQMDYVDPSGKTFSDIQSILVTPAVSYQYFNGSSFVDIEVPEYVHFFCKKSMVTIKGVNMMRWENDFTGNQYTSISSGPSRYKKD